MPLPEHTLKVFIRDQKRNPRGVVTAIKAGNKTIKNSRGFAIGWSMVREGEDKYNDQLGQEIALARAADAAKMDVLTTVSDDLLPHEVRRVLQDGFIKRCNNYFKKKKPKAEAVKTTPEKKVKTFKKISKIVHLENVREKHLLKEVRSVKA